MDEADARRIARPLERDRDGERIIGRFSRMAG
jgi:hypothetical protein